MGLPAIAHETIVSLSGALRPVRQDGPLAGDLARTAAAATFLLASLVGFAHGGSRDDIEFGAPAVETERIRQHQALEQERDRADRLARELASVRAELNAVQLDREHAIGAIELGIRQTHALELERDKVNNLARDLSFLRAELDAARIATSKAMQISAADSRQDPIVAPGSGTENAAAALASLRSDLDVARSAATEAKTALAAEVAQKEALEPELKQQREKSAALVTELTSLKAELETARTAASEASKAAAAEAAQREAMERKLKLQRDKADAAATELGALRTAANAARTQASDGAKAEEKLALEKDLAQQRDRADAAAKRLASVQAEFEAGQAAGKKASRAESEQKQTLERELGQQRDRADALARETVSLTNQRDDARSAAGEAARATDAAQAANKNELLRERNKSEALLRELTSTRKEVEERSTSLAAAYSEILRVTELNGTAAKQNEALAGERGRADGLARELASARAQLEDANGKLAAANSSASRLPQQTKQERAPGPASNGEGGGRSRELDTAWTVTSNPQPPVKPGSSTLQAQTPADPGSKVAAASERSAPASATPRALADEQRLLARANALLRQVDISSARQLLELALARGSAQAAFMLAETYDPPVLESWHARGVAGDRTKARDLYQRAKAGGIDGAEERIKALK
ncbi:hypothetical protein [Bradyrhizobium sp. LB11.1]|uniref:hypothetical protein n=1 Tax=Bradyrhizobium sp. LB11.1 TaxID=3156326 RepID=UPI00339A0A56